MACSSKPGGAGAGDGNGQDSGKCGPGQSDRLEERLVNFEDASLEEVMRQLERWYDIEVIYENGIPDIELIGEMTKDISLNGLLIVLGKAGSTLQPGGQKADYTAIMQV